MRTLAGELLGCILFWPEIYLDHAETGDFKDGGKDRDLKIFAAGKSSFQEFGYIQLDDVFRKMQAQGNDFEGLGPYLNELTDGLYKMPVAAFRRKIADLRGARKFPAFWRATDEQRKAIEQGGGLELDKIREQFQGLEKICTHPEDNAGSFFGTAEDFMAADIPPEEVFCDSIIFRGALAEVGGMKGTHKSFFMNSLALHLASGRSPFLNFMVPKPYRVLLIQQEISLGQHRARMERMIRVGQFETGGRLFTFTTTGRQRKLEKAEDLAELKKWISDCKPDILCLDPLSSFEQGEENNSRDRKRTVSILNELKAVFGLALVVSHHFSSKVSPDDPLAPKEAGGWFRGHSAFPDAADTLICLHRLPGQRENPNLPKSYEDYNLIEIQTRNGRWPARFAVEFDEHSFLLNPSSIWGDIGKKIIPGEIKDYVDERGGEALLKDIVLHFRSKAESATIRRAIQIEVKAGTLEQDRLPGKGRPLIIRRLNFQGPDSPAYPEG